MKPWMIILIVCAAIIAVALILVLVLKRGKKDKIKVDEAFMTDMFNALGGVDNIKSYGVENSRVKIELVDLAKASFDSLKELSPKGVFVTNNNVKMLFKYEASLIVKMLDKKLK